MLLRRPWIFCGLLVLCVGASASLGCVVRDRVTIIPRSHPPVGAQEVPESVADAGEGPTASRIGTNAVLPQEQVTSQSDSVLDEGTTPRETGMAEPGDVEGEGAGDPVVVEPAPAVDALPDVEPDVEPDTTPVESTAQQPVVLDPPLHPAWVEGGAYNRLYDIEQDAATVTGDISAVGTFIPAPDASPGLLLDISQGEGVIQVHVAPLRYLRAVGLRFDFGESLSVTGRWATINGQRILMAQSITRGETEIELRDQTTGRPVWIDPIPGENPADAATTTD